MERRIIYEDNHCTGYDLFRKSTLCKQLDKEGELMQEVDSFLKRGNRKGQSIYKEKVELNTDFIAKDSYILANFSKSSLAKEYHMQLFGSLNASIATYYEFKNQSSICITIENFLSWSLCGLNAAIIYFCDDISYISNNQRWFVHRIGKGDIIADINGNLIFL